MKKANQINWLTTSVLIILPIFIIITAIMYGEMYGIGKFEILLFVGAYYACNISVGLGFHRLWSHASYKINKVLEFILMLVSAATLQGPAIAWVSDHRFHHAFADTDKDPHTPVRYKNKLMGFFWAHIGWMLVGELTIKHIDKGTAATLGKNKILVFQLKYYWQIATFMNVVVPALIGYFCGNHDLRSVCAGLVFMGLGRAFQQQMTFCVNSVCHFMGSKKYANDTSGDIWWLFFLLLGENWHNFHHAFGSDYRNGHKWYHLDIHKWLIALLAKVGLASNLVRTPKERIIAVMEEMNAIKEDKWSEKLVIVERFADSMAALAAEKLKMIEKSASDIANSMKNNVNNMANSVANNLNVGLQKKLIKLEESASRLTAMVRELKLETSAIKKRVVSDAYAKVLKLERAAIALGLITESQLISSK